MVGCPRSLHQRAKRYRIFTFNGDHLPRLIDYSAVLEQMQWQQLKCHYYNSGAFGFADNAGAQTRAWIGAEDSSIRPEARVLTRRIAEPYERNLAQLASQVWQRQASGSVWVMPKSHWAFELGHGSREWMPGLMERVGVDFLALEHRTDAAAISLRFCATKMGPASAAIPPLSNPPLKHRAGGRVRRASRHATAACKTFL